MNKKRMIVLVVVISIVLCSCGSQGNRKIEGLKELTQSTDSGESYDAGADATESSEISEDTSENDDVDTVSDSSQTEFIPVASTGTFEYDVINNCVILDGDSYNISTNEMDCYAGYMFYWLTNGTMEDIRDSINNNELENKYWRGSYTDELHAKVKESTMLEEFTESGGKILNYYILNEQGFLSALELAQMPVVVEYSFNGETYHAIWVICTSRIAENEEVTYQITDIFYLDKMNGWGLEY